MSKATDLKEHYGDPHLHYGNWPIIEDPHKCTSHPFVPTFENGFLHSCGGYCDAKRKHNKNPKKHPAIFTNYPSDFYLKNQRDCDRPRRLKLQENFAVAGHNHHRHHGGHHRHSGCGGMILWILVAMMLCYCLLN